MSWVWCFLSVAVFAMLTFLAATPRFARTSGRSCPYRMTLVVVILKIVQHLCSFLKTCWMSYSSSHSVCRLSSLLCSSCSDHDAFLDVFEQTNTFGDKSELEQFGVVIEAHLQLNTRDARERQPAKG